MNKWGKSSIRSTVSIGFLSLSLSLSPSCALFSLAAFKYELKTILKLFFSINKLN